MLIVLNTLATNDPSGYTLGGVFLLIGVVLGLLFLLRPHGPDVEGHRPPVVERERAAVAIPRVTPSAQEMLARVVACRAKGAQWQEIETALNPDGDSRAGAAIVRIRGPHMFVPHVGLNVMKAGCDTAIAKNPEATRTDALDEAVRSMTQITDAGN